MAQLAGVKTISDREIEYEGVRYIKTDGAAQLGDIVRSETHSREDVDCGSFFLVDIFRNGRVGFTDDGDDTRGINAEVYGEFDYEILLSELTTFRRVESTPQSSSEIRALIEQKRAEIAKLEAQIAINVDDYVRVTGRTYDGVFNAGDVAQVTHYDGLDYDHPYLLRAILENSSDWANADAIVKITPAEAKAALIAQIEELFAEE